MFLGIDIGGTNIKGILLNDEGVIINFIKTLTPITSKDIEIKLLELINNLCTQKSIRKDKIKAIGIGAAGSIEKKKGIVITCPNIKSWNRYPLAINIKKKMGIPVFLENDATVAILGESWKGHGSKFKNWIMLTLGTGIGGGAVINNKLYTGQGGNSMEFGHTSINYRGKKCKCGNKGCLEIYASATAVVRFTKTLIKRYPSSSINKRTENKKLTSRIVYEEAIKGDELSNKVFKRVSFYLGVGIANFVNILNPEAVILGGGLSRAHKLIIPGTKIVVKDRALPGLKENIKFLITKDEEKIPSIGAAKIAMDSFNKI